MNNTTTDKTRRQWLEELPFPYREQAIANTINGCIDQGLDAIRFLNMNSEFNNLPNILQESFFFGDSPEGCDYWYEFVAMLEEE
jgi:hypothetical protein